MEQAGPLSPEFQVEKLKDLSLHDVRYPSTPAAHAGKSTQPTASFTFMTVNPTVEQDRHSKREVRSHIARRQHRQRRELKLERSTSDDTLAPTKDISSFRTFGRWITDVPPSQLHDKSSISTSFPARSVAPPRIASAQSILRPPRDPTDQLEVYSRQLGTSGSTVWAYYLWQEHQHGLLFHAQYSGFRDYAPKFLHPLIRSHPAILASTVLFTGCLLRQRAGDSIISGPVLRLRSLAYIMLQNTIDEMGEEPSDADILAVLKLALFEAVFGEARAYQMHMQGLVQMIRLRKGLSNIGMNGYLAHLLTWFDANLSAVSGSPRYLTAEAATDAIDPAKTDGEPFALGTHPGLTLEE